MSVAPESLRIAMRRWTSGVTVVTAKYGDVEHGMTVSSFASLALEPPLIMVALEKNTRTHALVENSGFFGVSILALDQVEVSNRFAMAKTETEYRFQDIQTFTLVSGVPLIRGGLAVLDCSVSAAYPAGTHTMYVGIVNALDLGERLDPLLYFNQGYRQLLD